MFKSLLLVLVPTVFLVGYSFANAASVPHQLSGGVIITNVTGTATAPETINYNVKLPSLVLCQGAITKIEQAFFSPTAAVTQGLASPGDAHKLVFLQCLPLTSPAL